MEENYFQFKGSGKSWENNTINIPLKITKITKFKGPTNFYINKDKSTTKYSFLKICSIPEAVGNFLGRKG